MIRDKLKDRGLSLIEVLVVTSVLAVVSLGVTAVITGLIRSMNQVDSRAGLAALISEIQLKLSSKAQCQEAFTQPGLQSFIRAQAETAAGLPVRIRLSRGPASTVDLFAASDTDLNQYDVRVSRIYYKQAPGQTPGVDPNGLPTYHGQLWIEAAPLKDVTGAQSFEARPIGSLFIAVNGGNQIADCFGAAEGSMDAFCRALNTTYNPVTGECNNAASCVTTDSFGNPVTRQHAQIFREPCTSFGATGSISKQCFNGAIISVASNCQTRERGGQNNGQGPGRN